MDTSDNKRLLQHIYDELAKGNRRPFGDALADDFTWIIAGRSAWAGTWRGRTQVREGLLEPLFAQFATPYRNTADTSIAEDDRVVVLCRGEVTTRRGAAYDNQYCNVFRLRDGKIVELIEYMDTELADRVLDAPAREAT